MIGITHGFGRHELMLEIDAGDFFNLGGVIQLLQIAEQRKRFVAARCIGNLLQFIKHDSRSDELLVRFCFGPPFARPLTPNFDN